MPARFEIVEQAARGVGDLACSPGIDQHQLCAGVHQQRRERYGQDLRRQERGGERVVDFGAARVADEFLVDRHIPDAVIERGELIAAEIVAIDAGALRRSRRCARRRGRCQRRAGNQRRAGQERAAVKSGHSGRLTSLRGV